MASGLAVAACRSQTAPSAQPPPTRKQTDRAERLPAAVAEPFTVLHSCLFLFPGILIIRKELLQNVDTVLGRIPPQDRTECVNRLPPPAVIGTETDIPDMGAQFLYDLFHVSQLLWGKERVIQQPVIILPILMFGTEQVNGSVQ